MSVWLTPNEVMSACVLHTITMQWSEEEEFLACPMTDIIVSGHRGLFKTVEPLKECNCARPHNLYEVPNILSVVDGCLVKHNSGHEEF